MPPELPWWADLIAAVLTAVLGFFAGRANGRRRRRE